MTGLGSSEEESDGKFTDFNKILVETPLIHELFPYSTTTLVIDTNVIFSELYFMIRKGVRETTLLTLARSKRVVLFFPEEKLYEIEEKFHKIAVNTSASDEAVRKLWENSYAPLLRFVPDLNPKETVVLETQLRDPDDKPFLRLASLLNPEWFLSQDKDLVDLGVAESNYVKVSIDLREYHAGQSMVYTFQVGGQMFTLVGVAAIYAFYQTIRALWMVIKRLPKWVQMISVVAILLSFTSPKVRASLKNLLEKIPGVLSGIKPVLGELLQLPFEYWENGRAIKARGSDGLATYRNVSDETVNPQTAEEFIIGVLAHSPDPLSVPTIARLVKNQGYRTSNSRFEDYIKRILRSRPIFAQNKDGKWSLGSMLEVAVGEVDKDG